MYIHIAFIFLFPFLFPSPEFFCRNTTLRINGRGVSLSSWTKMFDGHMTNPSAAIYLNCQASLSFFKLAIRLGLTMPLENQIFWKLFKSRNCSNLPRIYFWKMRASKRKMTFNLLDGLFPYKILIDWSVDQLSIWASTLRMSHEGKSIYKGLERLMMCAGILLKSLNDNQHGVFRESRPVGRRREGRKNQFLHCRSA